MLIGEMFKCVHNLYSVFYYDYWTGITSKPGITYVIHIPSGCGPCM